MSPSSPSAAAATSRLKRQTDERPDSDDANDEQGRREKARCDDGERERAIESDAFDRVDRASRGPNRGFILFNTKPRSIDWRVARPLRPLPSFLHHAASITRMITPIVASTESGTRANPSVSPSASPLNTARCASSGRSTSSERRYPSITSGADDASSVASASGGGASARQTRARGPRPARVRVRRP